MESTAPDAPDAPSTRRHRSPSTPRQQLVRDARTRAMELARAPIRVGDDAWIAADAFVGPGVTVGPRAIPGARASAFSEVPAGVVAVGNPAKPIKPRGFQP